MGNTRRYAIPIILWVVAAALLVVGVLSVTVWKPQQEVFAERSSEQPYSMTRPGVLPLYADKVEVRATGEPEQIVWLVLGSPDDVTAWLASEPYDEVVGLSDIETLKAITHAPETQEGADEDAEAEEADKDAESADEDAEETDEAEEEEPPGNPLESDMWTAMKYGVGTVSMVVEGDDLDKSIIAATDGESPSPTLSLRWETPQNNLLALISFTSALAMALLAAAMTGITAYSQRKRKAATVPGAVEPTVTTKTVEADDHVAEEPEVAVLAAEEGPEVTEEALEAAEEAPAAVEEVVPPVETEHAEFAPTPPPAPEPATPVTAQEPEAPEPAEVAEVQETVETAEVPEAPAGRRSVFGRAPEPAAEPTAEPARPAAPARAEEVVTETVTTESGMMNLAALQAGGAFPSRRALREARERGVDALIVGDRQYPVDPRSGLPVEPKEADRAQTWTAAVESITSENTDKEGR